MSDRIVAPYAGQNQQWWISVPATIRYREQMEEGPWVMPPYAAIFPPPTQSAGQAWVPPPVQTTDIFAAQQTWPL
jgi:hypothetical protein